MMKISLGAECLNTPPGEKGLTDTTISALLYSAPKGGEFLFNHIEQIKKANLIWSFSKYTSGELGNFFSPGCLIYK